tara:strand:- start:13709 stop:14857 length:1149 start_codon:yes stop_codon:yes gene_type:complete
MPPKKRIYYIDNVRSAVIALVILFHSAVAYSQVFTTRIEWYVLDGSCQFYDYLCVFFDTSLMATMFFAAGYFALASLIKHGAVQFVKDKLWRLFVPFLLGTIFLNPFPNFIRATLEGKIDTSYFSYWIYNYLSSMQYQLAHSKASVHLWFISMLFLFLLVLAFLYTLAKPFFEEKYTAAKPTIIQLLCFFSIGALGMITVNTFFEDFGQWYTVADFWTTQPTRLPLYIVYFTFGIVAWRYQWADKGFTNGLLGWLVTATAFNAFHLWFVVNHFELLDRDWPVTMIHTLAHSLACFSLFMLTLSFFKQKLNVGGTLAKKLSQNSYAIYIVHLNFVIALQYCLLNYNIAIHLKFLIVMSVSALASYLSSEYILKRVPILNKMLY